MNIKKFNILFFLIIVFSSTSISQENFSFGFKGGLGLYRIASLEESPNTGHQIEYSYPIGFSFGVYIQNKLFENISIVNELLYQNSTEKLTIFTGYDGILDQEITSKYLLTSILFKYHTSWLWNSYFFIGPSFGYLLRSDYSFSDHIYPLDKGNIEISKNLPAINTSLEFGFGKDIVISNSRLSMELGAQLGLTKFHYNTGIYLQNIGKWQNYGLSISIGYYFIHVD